MRALFVLAQALFAELGSLFSFSGYFGWKFPSCKGFLGHLGFGPALC